MMVMPRQSRIDAPGALHHVIIRGIERKAIVKDDVDRAEFIERIALIFADSSTPCFAWALMTNHSPSDSNGGYAPGNLDAPPAHRLCHGV